MANIQQRQVVGDSGSKVLDELRRSYNALLDEIGDLATAGSLTIAAADATTPGTGADATTPSGAEYTTCAVLANELKTDVNALFTALAAVVTAMEASTATVIKIVERSDLPVGPRRGLQDDA